MEFDFFEEYFSDFERKKVTYIITKCNPEDIKNGYYMLHKDCINILKHSNKKNGGSSYRYKNKRKFT